MSDSRAPNGSDTPYSCPDCDFAASDHGLVLQHMSETHRDDYPGMTPWFADGECYWEDIDVLDET